MIINHLNFKLLDIVFFYSPLLLTPQVPFTQSASRRRFVKLSEKSKYCQGPQCGILDMAHCGAKVVSVWKCDILLQFVRGAVTVGDRGGNAGQ